MPGLTVWLTARGGPDDSARVAAAHARMHHTPRYTSTVRISTLTLHVGHVNYPEYPLWYGEIEGVSVAIEGRCYNYDPQAVRLRLAEVARAFREGDDPRRCVEEFLYDADGEYVVLMALPERGQVLAFTDPLGILPVYYYADDQMLLLARECKFIQQLKPNAAFDRVGWAEYLCLASPLGDRTLFQDVHRGLGAMLLQARLDGDRVRTRVSSCFTYDFDDKFTQERPLDEYADELLQRFEAACRDRLKGIGHAPIVLCLTGGNDSRVVACGLQRVGGQFVGVTATDARWGHFGDGKIAKLVAEALKVEWYLFEFHQRTQDEMDRMVRLKDGANGVTMTFMLPFLEQIVARWGQGAVLVKGFGDHLFWSDNRHAPGAGTLEALAETMLRHHSRALPEVAEKIMSVPPGTLVESLRSRLNAYPEKSLEQKGAHFIIYERLRNWELEMQDRTNCFLWQTSPFFSFALGRYAMRIPDHLKQHRKLYRRFQAKLHPIFAEIPLARFGVTPGNPLYPLVCRVTKSLAHLPRPMKRVLRLFQSHRMRPNVVSAEQREYLQTALADKNGLGGLMNADVIPAFLDQATWTEFDYFWTLVTLEKITRADRLA